MKNEEILEILINADDYISGQALAEQLGVSRQAIWKGVKALKDSGCEIMSVTNRGYRLTALPDRLNAPILRGTLKTKTLGRELEVLETVDSTNEYLKRLGSNGAAAGTVVAAREQTGGKGRLGRVWRSKRDECVMFSVLLRPNLTPMEAGGITPLTGLAVCRALRGLTGLDCMIKWPNDIIVGSKKLVGILTELSAEVDAVEYLVTGIGINVDQSFFPEEIEYKATSLLLETGRHYDKNKVLSAVLEQMERVYDRSGMKLTHAALEEYENLCATVGRSVTFRRGTRNVSGMAVGIAEGGGLKVMLSDGSICEVNSGEVVVQGIY